MALWNDVVAEPHRLPKVAVLDADRLRLLEQRLREAGGLAGWEVAMAKAAASPLMRGEVPPKPGYRRPFRVTFDFVLKQDKFTRLMEGLYDPDEAPVMPSGAPWSRAPSPYRPGSQAANAAAMMQLQAAARAELAA